MGKKKYFLNLNFSTKKTLKRQNNSFDILNITKNRKFSEIENFKTNFKKFLDSDKLYFKQRSKSLIDLKRNLKKKIGSFIYHKSFSNSKTKKKIYFFAKFKKLYYNLMIKQKISKILKKKDFNKNEIFNNVENRDLEKLDKIAKRLFKKKKNENQFIKKSNKNFFIVSKFKVKLKRKSLFSKIPKNLIKIKSRFPTFCIINSSNTNKKKNLSKNQNNLKKSKTTKKNYLINKNQYLDDTKKNYLKKNYSLRNIKKDITPLKLYLRSNTNQISKIFQNKKINKKIIPNLNRKYIINRKLNSFVTKIKI